MGFQFSPFSRFSNFLVFSTSAAHRMAAEEEAQLEALNNAQDDDLPYQELTEFDYSAHGN